MILKIEGEVNDGLSSEEVAEDISYLKLVLAEIDLFENYEIELRKKE